MKNGKTHLFKTLTITAMLLLANRSHALFTPYLSGVSNDIAAYATTLTDPSDKAEARVVARVLKDLSKPSTSVAGDYNLLLQAALHLGPFALRPPFGEVGSNAFLFFMGKAQDELLATAARVGALNDFVRTKKAASNQVVRAAAILASIPTISDPRVALLVGGQVFAKLGAANKLAQMGEDHPGFAPNPDSLVGKLLEHHERGQSGTVHFDNATTVTETDSEGTSTSAYTYTRTGLNSATLVLTHDEGGGLTSRTTVKIRFAATTRGTFTFRNEDSDGSVNFGAGTFTLN